MPCMSSRFCAQYEEKIGRSKRIPSTKPLLIPPSLDLTKVNTMLATCTHIYDLSNRNANESQSSEPSIEFSPVFQ